MTHKKERPQRGTHVTPDMSIRDIASALGWSTGKISRAKRLAALPEDVFESIVEGYDGPQRLTAERILNLSRGWDMSPRRRLQICSHCGKPVTKSRSVL